jgi:hypothetical protein
MESNHESDDCGPVRHGQNPEFSDKYRRGVVDRMRRYRLMEKAAEHTDAIINLHAEVYQDTYLPVETPPCLELLRSTIITAAVS